jgi:GT2 family glycosyltransferase
VPFALPQPPDDEDLARATPPIPPVPAGAPRPFWSVMVPNHNAAALLRIALHSVLAQDPGADQMQIEVVDDQSTADDPRAVVAEVGQGRVAFHPNPKNLGATATFNECVSRARGQWVHLLHSDDAVLPGFYADCAAAIAAHPEIVMIVGQVVMIDEHGRWLTLTGPATARAGAIFPEFLREQALGQLAQFAGVVVRRDAYERLGGFCTRFGHVADRDMWFRVGTLGSVWCSSRPYGLYRVHGGADTGKQMVRGTNVEETYWSTCINLRRLRLHADAPEIRGWQSRLSRTAYRNAQKLRARGSTEGCLNQARWAFRLRPNPKTAALLLSARWRHRAR